MQFTGHGSHTTILSLLNVLTVSSGQVNEHVIVVSIKTSIGFMKMHWEQVELLLAKVYLLHKGSFHLQIRVVRLV